MVIECMEEQILSKYSVEYILGKGAKADVYYVRSKKDRKGYALKVSKDKKTLKTEAYYLEKVENKIFPSFVEWLEGEQGYLVMEYIEGRNLQEILDAGMVFSVDETVWMISEILDGVGYLHEQNPIMVYRDLKPANILIDRTGKLRIVDLGSVIEVSTQAVQYIRTGTYGYAAPEQFWEGMEPRPSWDVYAAGKLMGYLLTGKNPAVPPYHVEEFYEKDRRIPPAIKEIIRRCLSDHEQARYENAGALRRSLYMARDDIQGKKKRHMLQKKGPDYKKCIWLSDYRRIF